MAPGQRSVGSGRGLFQAGDHAVLTLPWPGGWPGRERKARARRAGRGRCLGKEAQLAAGGSGSGAAGRGLSPPAGTRAAGARAPRPPVMVGHLHLQAMGDTREQSRDGLLDSPDSGLPPSPSPSPPFYVLSPGTLDARATTEPLGPNEAPAVRRGCGGGCPSGRAMPKPAWSLPSRGRHGMAPGSPGPAGWQFRGGAGGLE